MKILAATEQRSISRFALDSALNCVEETPADRRFFGLDAEHWEAFLTALDAPPCPLPHLERLFAEPGLFERSDTLLFGCYD